MNLPDAMHGPVHRVLLCVSSDFDAQVLGNILGSVNAKGMFCRDPEEIARQAHGDADAVLVSEEMLDENSLEPIIASLSRQPEWSDLPVLLVRSSGAESPVVLRAMQALTNILLLDRPVRVAAMTSALIQALRARNRQYRLRDLLKLLRGSERKFRTVFEQAAIGIGRVRFDDARWIEVNETFCRMLGYTLEELLKTPWPKITHPDDVDLDLIPFRQMAAGELDSYTVEKRFIHKKKHHVWARLTLSLVRDAAGQPDYEIAVIEDITRRKQAEAELESTRNLLSEGQKIAHLGTFEYIADSGKTVWSEEEYRIYGLDPEGPSPDYVVLRDRYIHPEDADLLQNTFTAAIQNRSVYELEHRIVRPDGEVRWVYNRALPYADRKGRLVRYVGTTLDITDRKQAEEALRDYASRLKASLEEKEILLKEIHHRVKNNMQVISSLIFLQADYVKDAAMHNSMEELANRVRSMAMVHEMLYQSEDLARVDFADYARGLLEYLWRAYGTASSGIRLALDLDPVNLSVILAVPCGLILNELVSNALKHAFAGRAEGYLSVSLRRDAENRVHLQVKDNGNGLPAGMNWQQSGSLGLRLVQMLSRQIRATVEVASNDGTEFVIVFKDKQS